MATKEELPDGSNSIVLVRQSGTVGYWSHLDQYVINFSVEGTIDSTMAGLVESLDESVQKPGTKVLVSGKLYKKPDLPPPMLGGQEIFFLDASEITIEESH